LEIFKNTNPRLLYEENKKPNLLFFNFSQTSNNPFYKEHTGIRHKCKYEVLKNGFPFLQNQEFKDYMETLKTYKFCVSPPASRKRYSNTPIL